MVRHMDKMAIYGGSPVRETMLPYVRQSVDEQDISAVVAVLRSDWITTGPKIQQFESLFAGLVGAAEAVAVSSGTAALHAAMNALDIGPGDEVIVPAITFAATANCVLYQGGTPIFADVEANTLLLDPDKVEGKVTTRTKAIIAVDYAGQPCNYESLSAITNRWELTLVDDACHALGARYRGRPVGSLASLNTFSFHPAKHITTGEGGIVTTDDPELAKQMRRFRNHGIAADDRADILDKPWFSGMRTLGYNYRITDFQCALGMSQLPKLPAILRRRRQIAALYNAAFSERRFVEPLHLHRDVDHSYHLYVVQFDTEALGLSQSAIIQALRSENIGVNVHYVPVYLHPYYHLELGIRPGICPTAEAASKRIITLPLFPEMTDEDAYDVIAAIDKLLLSRRKN